MTNLSRRGFLGGLLALGAAPAPSKPPLRWPYSIVDLGCVT